MTELRLEGDTLPGATLGEESPLPIFRDRVTDRRVALREPVPDEMWAYLGWQTGNRVLPYRLQDRYTRDRRPLTLPAIVLENEFLRATFWPSLGGRMVSLVAKPQQRELLYRNPVFQPANLALRNAWFAGGVEWNVGQYGHAFHTCAPIFAVRISGLHGEPGLRLYEYERCKGLFWQLDFFLPPGSRSLIAAARVINPHDTPTSLYWWTNIAVPEAADVRVLGPTSKTLYLDRAIHGFGYGDLPYLPTINGRDATYATNFPSANEFFFECQEADLPWVAALDAQGCGLVEASTRALVARKLFCWGMHQGGRHWQEFLAQPGMAYIEVQAGLAPSQLHGLPMPAHSSRDWVEVFGYLETDPRQAHSADWQTAWTAVDKGVKALISASDLAALQDECRARADTVPEEVLHHGSGWGALEQQRATYTGCGDAPPPSLLFPAETLGAEQRKWLTLLMDGRLPEQNPLETPGEWMVQPEWRTLLERSLREPRHCHWYALLHYGIVLMEHFDEAGAVAAWQESLQRAPSIWAYRNLGVAAQMAQDTARARYYYDQAWQYAVAIGLEDALVREYLGFLCRLGDYGKAREVLDSLPAQLRDDDRVRILRGRIALELGDLATVEEILSREYAIVREEEVELTDLWFGMWQKRVAAATGRPIDAALRREVEAAYPPPARIDFRSIA